MVVKLRECGVLIRNTQIELSTIGTSTERSTVCHLHVTPDSLSVPTIPYDFTVPFLFRLSTSKKAD
jgi:hypothetical protein